MSKTYRNILVIRLSSLGDVLTTLPVLFNVLEQQPDVHFYVLTKPAFASVFTLLPRCTIVDANFKQQHKGFLGLWRLFFELKKNYRISAVADLHNVLRTKILRILFFFSSNPFAAITKNRTLKTDFLSHKINALPRVWHLYETVFKQLELQVSTTQSINFAQRIIPTMRAKKIIDVIDLHQFSLVAIAPFAAHQSKIYPLEKTAHLVQKLVTDKNKFVFLLGKGETEKAILKRWKNNHERIILLDEFSLLEQLFILQYCNAALTMDSANLHLAGLAGIKNIVTIFGATTPAAGFCVWNNVTPLTTEIACQPCSIFGNKPCARKDHLCLQSISTQSVLTALLKNGE